MSKGITFAVDDVEPARTSFPADEASISAALTAAGAGPLLVKSWDGSAPLFAVSEMPALAAAAKIAHDSHLPLVLSPDAVWITITQGFAHHVRLHAEELRRDLVRHDGKKRLEIIVGDVEWDEAFWRPIIGSFAAKIGAETGEIASLLVCDFSTTGPVERTASQVVLMDAMQSYFEYVVRSICGIPSITLEGTPEDWRRLCQKVERLGHYGLEFWTKYLAPICEQFARASAGDVTRDFWRHMVRADQSCGGDVLTGWICHLFPYLKDDSGAVSRANCMAGGFYIRDLPGGLSTAPVEIEYPGGKLKVRLCAGLMGLAQDEETRSLRPIAGWALCSESPLERVRARLEAESEDFRQPLSWDELGRRFDELRWNGPFGWEHSYYLMKSQFFGLYSVTDGASLHDGQGDLPVYRILPFDGVELFYMVTPRGYAEWRAIVDRWQEEGKLEGETPEMAMARIAQGMPLYVWLRFCDLSDGSCLAVRFDDGQTREVAWIPNPDLDEPAKNLEVADSLLACIERMLDNPTPWWYDKPI